MPQQYEPLIHQFISPKQPIFGLKKNTQALILGTIYPSKSLKNFKCPFFYGNNYTFWGILYRAFGGSLEIDPADKLSFEGSAEKIKIMLKKYGIAVSDCLQTAVRTPSAYPSQDRYTEGSIYNKELIEALKNSSIKTIFFTSKATCKIFIKNVCALPKMPFESSGEAAELPIGKSDTINKSVFGKEICCTVLPSSSGRANTCKRFRAEKENNPSLKYADWRISFYKEIFLPLIKGQH